MTKKTTDKDLMASEQVGRLAFRVEEPYWKAYYARLDSMEDAVLLGQVVFAPIAHNDELKMAFMQLMRDVLTITMNSVDVQIAGWHKPVLAPDSERKE